MKRLGLLLNLFIIFSACAEKKDLIESFQAEYFSIREAPSPWGASVGGDSDITGWSTRKDSDAIITIDMGNEVITISGYAKKEFQILNAIEILEKLGHNWNSGILQLRIEAKDINNRNCKFIYIPTGGERQLYLIYPDTEYVWIGKD